jgi:hypothetical protein
MEEPDELDGEVSEAIRAFAAEERKGRTPHVLPEDLLAYQEGQLSEEESEAIRDHLEVCPECAGLVLDLARFPEIEPAAAAAGLSEEQRWEALRARLEEEGDLGPASPQGRETPLQRSRPLSGLLAAGLAAACLGLALWVLVLQQRLAELSRPAGRIAVSSLVPRETGAERAPEGIEPTAVPAWADRVLLILNLFEPRSYSAYQVEIFDAPDGGEKVWSSRDLHRAADGSFAFEVPRAFLPAGSYRIELSGLAGSRIDPLAVYNLLLVLE